MNRLIGITHIAGCALAGLAFQRKSQSLALTAFAVLWIAFFLLEGACSRMRRAIEERRAAK